MPSVDTRIVQMQFDNRDFEKNIAVSQESLEKFKDELDFEEQEDNLRDFGDAVKSFSFDSMAENLQKLTDKFTGLGTISELVLSQIRRGIETAAAKISSFVSSMTTQQVSEGQSKFDMLNKSVQTIKAATGRSEADVYNVMDRLNKYTDQTSYNFADMAQNIGKFTSVGIKLEDAEMEMEGIANWAARSGAGINEASRAMYNLSQAMGVGSLKLMDWKSIENAGMATKEFKEQLIQAGLAAKTLEKDTKTGMIRTAKSLGKQEEVTFMNLSQTLNKGWANKSVLESTLKKYYWEDLYYDGTEALIQLDEDQKKIFDNMFIAQGHITNKDWKTLEAMGIMTKEVKEKLLELAVTQGSVTKEVDKDGKTMYSVLDKNKNKINFTIDEIEKSLTAGWFTKELGETATSINELAKESFEAAQKCLTFADVIQAWKDQISTGFMASFKHIFGELSESMELFSAICNKVGDAFSKVIETINGSDTSLGILGQWAQLGGRESLWGLFVGEYDGLYEGAVGILDIFTKIGDMISEGFWHMVRLINPASLLDEAFNEKWDMNEDYRQQFLAEKLNGITEGIQEFLQKIKDFLNAVPTGSTKSRFQMIQDVVNAVYATFVLAYSIAKKVIGFVGGIFKKLEPSATSILALLSRLGLGISDTAHEAATGTGLTDFFGNLLNALTPLTDAINSIIGLITNLITKVIDRGTQNGTFNKILDFLGKLLTILVDVISRVAGPFIDFIGDIIDAVSTLFEEGINEKSMTKFGKSISDAIEKLLNGVLDGIFGSDAAKKINEFFGYVFGFDDGEVVEGEAQTAVGAIKMWFKKIFGVFGGLLDGFKNEEGEFTLFSLLKNNLGLGAAGTFIKSMTEIFSSSNIFKLTKAFGGLLTLFKGFQMLSKGKTMFKTIGGFFEGLGDSLKKGISLDVSDKTETAGEKFLKIAAGIALIAAAVAVLGSMKISSLIKGVATVGLIMLFMGLFVKFMKSTIEGMGLAEIISMTASIGLMGIALTGIIIGITLLVLALKPLANMHMDQIATMLTGLGGIVLILGLFAKYVSGDFKKVKSKDMFAMALLALGIGVLVRSLKPLAKISWEGMAKMGVGLLAILLMLAGFSRIMGSLKGTGMLSAILLAISIGLLIATLKPLANLSMDGILKMLSALGVVLLMLVGFSTSVKSLKGTALGKLILLAGSIWILVEALKPLAAFSWENLAKMGAGLGAILLMLSAFNSGLGSYRFGEMAGVIAVAVSIWVLVRALTPLASVSWEGLARMAVGLIVLLGTIYVLMELSKGMKIREGVAAFAALIPLAVVLLAFGLSMQMMQGVEWDTIVVSMIALSVLLVVYFAMVDMINSNEKSLMKGLHALVAMVGLAAVVLVFSMALNEIKTLKVDKILAFSLGLAALLIAMAEALKITSKLSLSGAIKGILILGAAVAAIMAVLSLVMPLVIGAIGSSLEKLSAKLILISSMLTSFISNMSGMSEEQIDSAKRKFESLYNLIAGLQDVSSYMQPLANFTTMIRKLGAALRLYINLTGNVKGPDNDPAIRLIDKICSLKDQINGFALGTFSDNMASLGGAISSFVNPEGKGSVQEEEPIALKLLKNILACKNDIQAFSELDLDGFIEVLQGLGGALSLYALGAKEVTGLTDEELSADGVSGAVRIMTAISDSLNENGSFKIPDLPSEADLKDFPSQLAALANAVVSYANACKKFDDGKADAGLEALDFLAELNKRLTTDTVAVVDVVTKEVKVGVMSRFATNIRLLGGALYSFYESTKDFGDVSNATKALEFFKQLNTDLTKESIKATLIFEGTNVTPETLGTFSEDIVALGAALQDFANNTKFDSDTSTTFDNALQALRDLIKMRNEMPDVGGIVQWFTGHKEDFGELADDITVMGAGLMNLSKALNGEIEGQTAKFNADVVNSALSSVASFTEIMSALSYIPEDKLRNGFSYVSVLADLLNHLQDDIVIEYDASTGSREVSSVLDGVAFLMHQICETIAYWNENGDEINMESIDMFARFAEGLNAFVNSRDKNYDFYGVGRNMVLGIKAGILNKDSDDDLVEAAKHMIKKLHDAAMAESRSASPSKLFRDTVGTYIALGVAAGIERNTDKPADAAEGLITDTLFGAEGALTLLSKLINGEEFTQPTITPILDLTNVESGVARLNGWFGSSGLSLTSGSLTIDPSRATIMADTAMPKDYTESMHDIRQEITNLREDVSMLNTSIKNIKLVMNTGAVVGAIGPEMDRYLGQRGFYSSRTDI